MKLSFLGQHYTASAPSCEGTDTGETATFLGKTYVRKQFNVTSRQQSAKLAYRGVNYSR